MSDTQSYRRLAQQLSAQKKKPARRPSLVHSTIQYGAIPVRDRDDQLTALVGEQYDGTFTLATVAGPVPPTPGLPSGTPVVGGVEWTWGGDWLDGEFAVAPMDFQHVELHVSVNEPDFSGLFFVTKRGEFTSARGGRMFVAAPPGSVVYARLVTRSMSGKASLPSEVAGPVPVGLIGPDYLDIDLAEFGGTRVFYGEEEPTDPAPRVGDLWLEDPTNLTYRFEETQVGPGAWILHRDQGITQAIQGALDAQAAADSKAEIHRGPTAPTDPAVNDLWISDDGDGGSITQIWDGDSWDERKIGNGSIVPASLVASDVIATGTITAALFEAILILATTIIAGDPQGSHARMTADGFQVYAPSPLVGAPPYVVVSMGNPATRDTLGVTDEDGNLLANINEMGILTAQGAYINADPTIAGRKLIAGWINELPRGVKGVAVGLPDRNEISTETPLFGCTWMPEAGRHYRITVSGIRWANSAGGLGANGAVFTLRNWYSDTMSLVAAKEASGTVNWRNGTVMIAELPAGLEPTLTNTVFSAAASGSSIHCAYLAEYAYNMVIEDIGPVRALSGQTYAGAGTSGAPPPTPGAQQYVWESAATWSQGYRSNGAQRTDTLAVGQGYGDSYNGNQGGLIGFPDLTVMLAGSTISQVLIYLYANHWWNNAGGTAVIGAHGLLNKPSAWAGPIDANRFHSGGWPRAAGRWIDVTGWAADIKVGLIRGFVTGPAPSNAAEYYGSFNGAGQGAAPRMRITFTK